MGQAVVHFEVIGKDGQKLQSYYGELFGWQIDSSNPMNYGVVQRDGNTNSEGEYPTPRRRSPRPRSSVARVSWGPMR
jgi:predicted enzyme related to lactoylglutathione lyase